MTIREYLQKLGATDAELRANVVNRMESAMLIDTDLSEMKADTVECIMNNTLQAIATAQKALMLDAGNARDTIRSLESMIAQAKREANDLREQVGVVHDSKINDPTSNNAVKVYAATLNATKEIFGEENLAPEVMISAIQAGSYMAWRSIMGPKEPEGQKPIRL